MTTTFLLDISDALAAIVCGRGLSPTHAGMARNPHIDVAAVVASIGPEIDTNSFFL